MYGYEALACHAISIPVGPKPEAHEDELVEVMCHCPKPRHIALSVEHLKMGPVLCSRGCGQAFDRHCASCNCG